MVCMATLYLYRYVGTARILLKTVGSGLLASGSTKGSVWDTIRIPTIQAPLPPGSPGQLCGFIPIQFLAGNDSWPINFRDLA